MEIYCRGGQTTDDNGCTKVPRCYVIRAQSVLLGIHVIIASDLNHIQGYS